MENRSVNSLERHELLLDEQAFPTLSPEQIEQCEQYGNRCKFSAGEELCAARAINFDSYVIISGEVCVMDVSAGSRSCLVRFGPGHFTGDIDMFTGRPAVVACEAASDIEAIRIAPAKFREMFVRNPELGEIFWRSVQDRRRLLLKTIFKGLQVYGDKNDKLTLETMEFLSRNGVPHRWVDIADPQNVTYLQKLVTTELRYPTITHGKKVLFQSSTIVEIAEAIGLRHNFSKKTYDVIILGAGPSGLGAAVYAASEGLSTLVLDALGPGGQAGSSSKIENYAGFPNGISGWELAQQSYLQAVKFGAQFASPCHVDDIQHRDDGCYEIRTAEGDTACGKTIIIATGVDCRLLDVAGLEKLKGSGVYYSATAMEAVMCKDCPIHIVGGGNSAGQAAMYLSQHTKEVKLILRADNLEKSMSSYLSERVKVNPKIKIYTRTQVTAIEGTEHIAKIWLRDDDGKITEEDTTGLFVFIGARPRTDFLSSRILMDEKGYAITGLALVENGSWKEQRVPQALETSMPGIFASGDCRSGTTKRVASAIGDGALAISCVHNYLGTYVH